MSLEIIETNRIWLKSLFSFKHESQLLSYINSKDGTKRKYYTLAEILTILRDTIKKEKMYDEYNPSVILCSTELENAINIKTLHVTEIRNVVLSHLDLEVEAELYSDSNTTSEKDVNEEINKIYSDSDTTSEEDVNEEYEPETSDDTERPPQAMGRTNYLSYTSNSDTEIDAKIIDKKHKKDLNEDKKELIYWGDSETNNIEINSNDSELRPANTWACCTCNKQNKPYYRYCATCWKIRREWLGYDTIKKGRLKRIAQARQKQMDKATETDYQNETQDMELLSTHNNHNYQPSNSQLCSLCCTNPKDASLVHGKIGHQLCCYTCAKKLWRKHANCPICRRKIEKIIKVISA